MVENKSLDKLRGPTGKQVCQSFQNLRNCELIYTISEQVWNQNVLKMKGLLATATTIAIVRGRERFQTTKILVLKEAIVIECTVVY